MRLVLLTLVCATAMRALPHAQAVDLSEILRALRAGEGRPPNDAATADIWRLAAAPRFRNFSEFHGTWVLDETATAGIRYAERRTGGRIPFDAIGMEVARRIVITGTDTQIALTKDDGVPEPYGFDGIERQATDPRSGAALTPRYSFAFVAGALALTSRTTSCCDADRRSSTEILTDAYTLAEFDVLKVERQLSILREPPGSLMTLSGARSLPHTITYQRAP